MARLYVALAVQGGALLPPVYISLVFWAAVETDWAFTLPESGSNRCFPAPARDDAQAAAAQA